MFDIVNKCVNEKITVAKATQVTLDLIDEDNSQEENQSISCFKSLIENLAYDYLEAKESELITRLLQPFLQPLFEDRANDRYLQ